MMTDIHLSTTITILLGTEASVLTYATASHDRFIRVFGIPANPTKFFVDNEGNALLSQPPPPTYLLRLQVSFA